MTRFTRFLQFGLWLILAWRSSADQTVLIDRPNTSTTWEPYFNPKQIKADIGERVHFVANFQELFGYPLAISGRVCSPL